MANNLIVCPAGMYIPKDLRWKHEDHWRWTHNERDYETLLIVYNDYEPEPGSYDHIVRIKGHKWQLMQKIKDRPDLLRDPVSGAIVKVDRKEVDEYRRQKAMINNSKSIQDDLLDLKEKYKDFENIKSELQEIKNLLKEIVNK